MRFGIPEHTYQGEEILVYDDGLYNVIFVFGLSWVRIGPSEPLSVMSAIEGEAVTQCLLF
jgi:hypothetical protein